MYPVIRLFKELLKTRNQTPLKPGEVHISHHICWPHDIDMFWELNNGRTLTLYDLGRLALAKRSGYFKALKENNWGLTIAGVSVRYRRRVRAFDRLEMHTRFIGYDEKFIYMDQSMWHKGNCTSQALIRAALTNKNGLTNPQQAFIALGYPEWNPTLPDWVKAWSDAEATRIWPPEH